MRRRRYTLPELVWLAIAAVLRKRLIMRIYHDAC
jgi:hypothetical protein